MKPSTQQMKPDMNHFTIRVAGINVEINTMSSGTYGYCVRYLSEEKPDMHVFVSQADVSRLMQSSHLPLSEINMPYLETAAVYEKIAEGMLDYSTFLMHGAVVAVGENAWMFCAKSGTGKTTHIRKWKDNLSQAYIVNGDKPLIKVLEDRIIACGTPWCGKERFGLNTMVPLKGIVFLNRSESNEIHRISFSQAYPYFLTHIHMPSDPEKAKKTISLVNQLNGKVACFLFQINNFKEDCFQVAYNALVGVKNE